MNYQTQFSLDALVGEKLFVDLIRKAGREKQFLNLIEDYFSGSRPFLEEIERYIHYNRANILHRLCITADGTPLHAETFNVSVRLGGIIRIAVEAHDPEAAREAARNLVLHMADGAVLTLCREDLTTVVPISYELDDGSVTHDYGPTPEERDALQKEADAHKLWALMRLERDACGHVEVHESKMFVSLSEAQTQMAHEYSDRYEQLLEGELALFQTPSDGDMRCYLSYHDMSMVEWVIVEAKLFTAQWSEKHVK